MRTRKNLFVVIQVLRHGDQMILFFLKKKKGGGVKSQKVRLNFQRLPEYLKDRVPIICQPKERII